MTTVNPVQNATYDLTTANNPITFGSATKISGYPYGVYGSSAAHWTVTNQGSIFGDIGIELLSESTLTNTGTVYGYDNGVELLSKSTLSNSGFIYGYDYGVILKAGGTVTNNAGGRINTYEGASIRVEGGGGFVTNAGSITINYGLAVELYAGGSVTNQGFLQGGIFIGGGVGSVTNTGEVTGRESNRGGHSLGDQNGVVLGAGGSVDNDGGLEGSYGVIIEGGAGKVENGGFIGGAYSAIELKRGGSVDNLARATIEAGDSRIYLSGQYGVSISGGVGKVTNAGSISAYNTAIAMTGGGNLTNSAGARIDGREGVIISGGVGKVANAGLIKGSSTDGEYGYGVSLGDGGSVSNAAGATISANYVGIAIGGRTANVTNAGNIDGALDGVVLESRGTVTNAAGGNIVASGIAFGVGYSIGYGVVLGEGGRVTNAGNIISSYYGVVLRSGGSIVNETGGYIGGGVYGVILSNGGAVTNAGTIRGHNSRYEGYDRAVLFGGSGKNTLTLQTGSQLIGDAYGSTDASATNAVNLLGTGTEDSSFHDFQYLTAKGTWVLDGSSSFDTITVKGSLQVGDAAHPTAEIDGAVTVKDPGSGVLKVVGAVSATTLLNGSLVEVAGGTLSVAGAATGLGRVDIDAGAAQFGSTFSQNVAFTGATGLLDLAQSQSYTGAISGFSHSGGTQLDLRDIGFVSPTEATFSGTASGGTLMVTDGTHAANITLLGNYMSSTFVASSDSHGGTLVQDPASGLAALPLASPRSH